MLYFLIVTVDQALTRAPPEGGGHLYTKYFKSYLTLN